MDLRKLLLKDLCARLPYSVICKSKCIEYDDIDGDNIEWDVEGKLEVVGDDYVIINSYQCELDETKPYLRPMSSMTEEEKKEYESFIFTQHHEWDGHGTSTKYVEVDDAERYVTWLNKKMFDWRGLIRLGLAIDCTNMGIYD